VSTVRALAVQLGVVEQKGAYFSYGDLRIHGKRNFDLALWDDPELCQEVYETTIRCAIDQSGAHSVPET